MHQPTATTCQQLPATAAAAAFPTAHCTELQVRATPQLLCATQSAVGTLQECAIWAKAAGYVKAAATIQRQADELKAALGAASQGVIHPTQTAPLCKDCAHMQSVRGYLMCGHPSQPRDTTNGSPFGLCESVRNRTAQRAAESKDRGFCGESGLLFTPRVSEVASANLQR